jgi:hypothetical protein
MVKNTKSISLILSLNYYFQRSDLALGRWIGWGYGPTDNIFVF